jgi:hypothetical protein
MDWEKLLSDSLTFPFDGVIDDDQELGSLVQFGDIVVVTKSAADADRYGIIAGVGIGSLRRYFPIVDIDVADKKSPNFKILDEYKEWFANDRWS